MGRKRIRILIALWGNDCGDGQRDAGICCCQDRGNKRGSVWRILKHHVDEARKNQDISDLNILGIDEFSVEKHHVVNAGQDLCKIAGLKLTPLIYSFYSFFTPSSLLAASSFSCPSACMTRPWCWWQCSGAVSCQGQLKPSLNPQVSRPIRWMICWMCIWWNASHTSKRRTGRTGCIFLWVYWRTYCNSCILERLSWLLKTHMRWPAIKLPLRSWMRFL